MNDEVSKGAGVLEGIVAILFGAAAVFWPGATAVTLLYLFAAFILAGGLINFMVGIFSISKDASSAILKALVGLLQIGVGVYLFRHPKVTFATLILIIGFTLIIRGVIEVVLAFAADASATMKTLIVIAGILSIIVGIVVLFQPAASGIAFIWILGAYALISGPLLIAAAVDNGKSGRK